MTKIEWTDETWNPVTGCTPISAGCRSCYARRMARRLAGRYGYPEAPNHFDVTLHYERLNQPFRWHKSRMIFVCSMSDLFHIDVPYDFIGEVFRVIYEAHWHTFQVLTKRPQNALEFVEHYWGDGARFPDNVWLGVSAENQQTADERRESFRKISAAVKFVSYEPALGPVDWLPWLSPDETHESHGALVGEPLIDWAICGAETGPGARPMKSTWARSLRNQARKAGVAFFMKQMSGKETIPDDLMIREFPK